MTAAAPTADTATIMDDLHEAVQVGNLSIGDVPEQCRWSATEADRWLAGEIDYVRDALTRVVDTTWTDWDDLSETRLESIRAKEAAELAQLNGELELLLAAQRAVRSAL